MQKLKYIIMILVACAIFITCSNAVDVRVNFTQINLPTDAVIQNNRTLVPLRVLSEIFGAKVHWEESGKVTVYHNNNIIILNKDSEYISVNGKSTKTDAKVIEKEDYMMVPLKFFSDYLGLEVEWYGNSRIVNIVIKDEEILKRAEEVSRSYNRKSVYEGYTVVLDPGHGGTDKGAYYGGIAEKTINLNIAQKVKEILEKYDIKVYMTRTKDVTTSLAARTNLANSINADLYISIHSNAIANSSIKGTEILYKQNSLVQDGVTNKILAQNLSGSVSEYAGTYKRGLINRSNLYVLNRTTMPAALVEVGYMTNTSDLRNLKNESFRKNVAEGIADGILDTLMIMIKT
ncbi:MAG: hypothetical protein E7314_01910 [Clostridiales bacterium]|nr:hypothetical protein [Clostridiales bacterium]